MQRASTCSWTGLVQPSPTNHECAWPPRSWVTAPQRLMMHPWGLHNQQARQLR